MNTNASQLNLYSLPSHKPFIQVPMLLPLSLICNLSQVLNHALCLCQLYYSISQLGFCQLYSTVTILQVHLYKACHLTLHIQTILYLYILLINHNLILSWALNRSNKNVFLFSSSGNAFACFIQSQCSGGNLSRKFWPRFWYYMGQWSR